MLRMQAWQWKNESRLTVHCILMFVFCLPPLAYLLATDLMLEQNVGGNSLSKWRGESEHLYESTRPGSLFWPRNVYHYR